MPELDLTLDDFRPARCGWTRGLSLRFAGGSVVGVYGLDRRQRRHVARALCGLARARGRCSLGGWEMIVGDPSTHAQAAYLGAEFALHASTVGGGVREVAAIFRIARGPVAARVFSMTGLAAGDRLASLAPPQVAALELSLAVARSPSLLVLHDFVARLGLRFQCEVLAPALAEIAAAGGVSLLVDADPGVHLGLPDASLTHAVLLNGDTVLYEGPVVGARDATKPDSPDTHTAANPAESTADRPHGRTLRELGMTSHVLKQDDSAAMRQKA